MPYDWSEDSSVDNSSYNSFDSYDSYSPAPSNPPRYINNGCVKTVAILKLIQGILATILGGILAIGGFIIMVSNSHAILLGLLVIMIGAIICALPLMEGIGAFKTINGNAGGAAMVAKVHSIYRILIIIATVITIIAVIVCLILSITGMSYMFGTRVNPAVIIIGGLFTIALLCALSFCLIHYETCVMDIMYGVSNELSSNNRINYVRNAFPIYAIIQIVLCAISFILSLGSGGGSVSTYQLRQMGLDYQSAEIISSSLRTVSSAAIVSALFPLAKSILVYLSYNSYKNNI